MDRLSSILSCVRTGREKGRFFYKEIYYFQYQNFLFLRSPLSSIIFFRKAVLINLLILYQKFKKKSGIFRPAVQKLKSASGQCCRSARTFIYIDLKSALYSRFYFYFITCFHKVNTNILLLNRCTMSRVKFSKLTDEEIHEIMESGVTSGEEDSNSGNDSGSLNHEPEEISPEDEHLISLCLRGMDTSANFFNEAADYSLTTSTVRDTVTADEEDIPSTDAITATCTALFLGELQFKRRELVRRYQDPKAPVQPLCQPMVVLMA